MVDVADTEPAQAPSPAPPEPVRVVELSEIQERIAVAMTSLRGELTGLHVGDEEELRTFQHHVSLRIAQWRDEGLANAILAALLIERLCGVSDKAVVKVPRQLLNRRVATR